MEPIKILIDEYLRIQKGRRGDEDYGRVAIPIELMREYDIRPGDFIKIAILDHLKNR